MKIAVFEPQPRVCGPAAWAGHVIAGIRELGHQADYVSFTKSGRGKKWWGESEHSDRVQISNGKPLGGSWWSSEPDVIAKWDDAGEVLNGYDLILLAEPKNSEYDKAAMKTGDVPEYLKALASTSTTWVTTLHGPQYTEKQAPFLGELFALPNMHPVIFTPNEAYRQTRPDILNDEFYYVTRPLPYSPKRAIDHNVNRIGGPHRPVIGYTGRVTPNKGPHVPAFLAQFLPTFDVEVWGSSAVGMGPNFSYHMWEMMLELGYIGERFGPLYDATRPNAESELCGADCCGEGKRHTPINPFPWRVYKDTQRVEYHGNFTDPVGTCERFDIHFNLTSVNFSNGLVEFTTLEAMDAGTIPLLPQHIAHGEYWWFVYPNAAAPPSIPKLLRGDDDALAAARDIYATIDRAKLTLLNSSPDEIANIVMYNRTELRKNNSARAWAEDLVGVK